MVKVRDIIHNYYIDIIRRYPLGSSYPKIAACYASTFMKMQYDNKKGVVFYKGRTQ